MMDWLETKFSELEIEAELEVLKKEVYRQSRDKSRQTTYQTNENKGSSSNGKLNRYYNTLNIQPGASPKDIKQAYRDLVAVWHPDRFSNTPRLQKIAEEKIKEINEAYEKLYSR